MSASTGQKTLRPIHTKILKSHSCKIWIWSKAFEQSTLKIDQFIFTKHFEKTSPCSDKFTCSVACFKTVFWKNFTRQHMAMKSTRSRNDVRCPFVLQSYKT